MIYSNKFLHFASLSSLTRTTFCLLTDGTILTAKKKKEEGKVENHRIPSNRHLTVKILQQHDGSLEKNPVRFHFGFPGI